MDYRTIKPMNDIIIEINGIEYTVAITAVEFHDS